MAVDLEESCAFLVGEKEAENPGLEKQQCKRIKASAVVSILSLLLVAGAAWWEFSPHSSSPSSHSSRNSLVQLNEDTKKTEEPQDDDEAPSPPPPVIPAGKPFTLTGVTGEIASLFAPESDTKGMDGKMHPSVPMAKAARYLKQMSLLAADADPGQCRPVDQNQNATADNACYSFYSGGTNFVPGRATDITDMPALELKVTIFYEKLLDNDLIAHVRGLQGISATQRAQYCDQLRANKVFQARQLPSISNLGAMLEKAGIDKGTPAYGSVESMTDEQAAIQAEPTGHAQLLDSFKKQNEFNEAAERSQAEIEKHIAAAEGARDASAKAVEARVKAAKAEAKEAIAEVNAAAAKQLQAVTSKLAGLELGKADLKSAADELQKAAGITNDGTLGKGKKLTTMQLIYANGIFAGRFFHQGSASENPRGNVVEFTSEALGAYGPQKPATPATTVPPKGLTSVWQASPKPKPIAPPPDKLYAKVVKFPSESTAEYMFQSTKSSDQRSATRMYDTYGSSASEYVEEENNIGVSVGVPGILSASAAYADKKSSSEATNKQGNSQKDESFKVTTSDFYQTKYYMEPRSVLDIPEDLVQSSASFLSRVRALKAKPDLEHVQVANMVFDEFGTHVCLRVTLGGLWRLSSRASSKEQETVAAMSQATSEASSKITSQSSQAGYKAGGTFMMSSVPVTVGVSQSRGQASSDAEESTNAHGEANQESSANKSIEVTTQQTWYGGLSGGSASAWRLSLADDQNSNWRVIGKRFEDCTPIWMYFPEEHKDFAKYACTHWFTQEINDAEITKQAKLNLLGLVEKKCTIEPESTHLGVMREAIEAAMTEAETLRENIILQKSRVAEQKQMIEKLKNSYLIHEVIVTLSSDVSGDSDDFNWGSALSEFQGKCQDLNYPYGFPTGVKKSSGWKGWCLKGPSFKKIDIESHDATDSNWNYLRNAARIECQNRHFDGGFPDGNQKYGVRGVVCFKGLKDTVFTELDSPTVKQHSGWSGIAEQADKHCKKESGKNGYPHFAAGIPGRADKDGHNAKLICLISEKDLIKEANQKLVRYEEAADSVGGLACPKETEDKKCKFEDGLADSMYCKTWKSVKPRTGTKKNDRVDFEWWRGKSTSTTGLSKTDYFMFTHASALSDVTVTGSCNGRDGLYSPQGVTASGATYYYSTSTQAYLYYDPSCDGGTRKDTLWILSTLGKKAPSTTASSDLDDDGRCDFEGRLEVGASGSGSVKTPLGTRLWRLFCSSSWTNRKVTLAEATTTTSIQATPAQANYFKKTSGSCDFSITSISECSTAAKAVKLSDTSASSDGQTAESFDPPYCYFEGGNLKFNSDGSNTGSCSSSDECICRKGTWQDSKIYRAKLEACGVNICESSHLTFDYSMHGDSMGGLQVWVGETKIWEQYGQFGQKGEKWHSADVKLYGKGCISIVGVRAEGSHSVVAIDKVVIESVKVGGAAKDSAS